MATKRQVHAAANEARRSGSTPLRGRPLDDNGTIELTPAGAPVPEEQGLITSSASMLSTWVGNVAAFLSTARTLEAKAGALETTAATLKQPTTAGADVELQRFIQTATATGKEIEGHWSIAKAVHDFHKLLVGYRERGVGKAERAKATAQRLHNAYVAAEDRRIQEENDRRQREAEDEARRKRDAEAAELEQRALDAEASSAELSAREVAYVGYMVDGLTSIRAAQLAGYKDPAATCGRLASTVKIQRAIFAAKEARAARAQAAAVKAAPLQVAPVEAAVANVTKIGSDRSTWKGECFDERLFVEAVLGGKHGIPADVLSVNQAKLTEYARSLHELMNRWPGVRAVKSTTTV